MGICGSSELSPEAQARLADEQKKSKILEDKMNRVKNDDQQISKLLLLGAGESGKSTLFKQMIMIYGTQETVEERMGYIDLVFANMVCNAKTLSENSHQHGEPETEEGKAARDFIDDLEDEARVTAEVAMELKNFWNDPGIQKCYENRALFQLNDSTKYFMDRVDTICEHGWIPTQDDIVRTRVRTTGIVENSFTIDNNPFKMFDVGGQRNERKKWIHCFENVTALMFVAAISEFDQVLYEDEYTNRMTEAIYLFTDIIKSVWFEKTSIILFLNKEDLFLEKIQTKDISNSACEELAKFQGDNRDPAETKDFIRNIFHSKCAPGRVISHFTCATNQANVKYVFDAVRDIIINQSLAEAGLA
jgi:GTPase SAR1 family protein